MKTKITLSAVIAAILMAGCGSSSDSPATTDTATGYFVDAAVANAQYKTSSGIAGETDEQGKFRYRQGDAVTFSIGKLLLGQTVPPTDGLVTPRELADQNETVVLMLQTLQSLDSDNNASNGITIDPSVVEKLAELPNDYNFSELNESVLVELDHELDLGLDENGDNHIDVDEQEAVTHMNGSVYEWKKEHGGTANSSGGFDINNYLPTPNLTTDVKETIAYMGNEERLAYDVYLNLYNYHKENSGIDIMQLYNIATNSESRHISIVQDLVKRYSLNPPELSDVNETIITENNMTADMPIEDMPSGVYAIGAIQNLYDTLYAKGIQSQQDALEVGCMVEVTDVNDLDMDIQTALDANATDVVAAFEVLRSGSYNHYWAFDKGLKNMGVTDGCCSLGEAYCHPEYPQNEQGSQGNGSHSGDGNGNGHRRGRQ